MQTITTDFTADDYNKYNEFEIDKEYEAQYWRIYITSVCDENQTQAGSSEIKLFSYKYE